MSRLQQHNGDDYPDAAAKHLADASTLMASARHDGAAYLAGYVVECSLKAIIQLETRQTHRSHDLVGLHDTLRAIATQATPRTQRVYASASRVLRAAGILTWEPRMRYRDAKIAAATAGKWLEEARETYNRIIGDLKLDGVI